MEALTGATIAALTVYDMCKALSHAIVIGPAKLHGQARRQARRGSSARMSARVTVLYFASLRDVAGVAGETFDTEAPDLRALYDRTACAAQLPLEADRLRVAVDGEFARWDDAPRDGSEIAFIPPVCGG